MLTIDYNQTRWDLYLYQITVTDITGTIMNSINTSNPVVTIPINEHSWMLQIVTHTRCYQKSVPIHINLQATSSEADNISSTIGTYYTVSTELNYHLQ
jgi:hypothetical protein